MCSDVACWCLFLWGVEVNWCRWSSTRITPLAGDGGWRTRRGELRHGPPHQSDNQIHMYTRHFPGCTSRYLLSLSLSLSPLSPLFLTTITFQSRRDVRVRFTMAFARNVAIFTVTISFMTFVAFFGRLPAFRCSHPYPQLQPRLSAVGFTLV